MNTFREPTDEEVDSVIRVATEIIHRYRPQVGPDVLATALFEALIFIGLNQNPGSTKPEVIIALMDAMESIRRCEADA